MGGPIPQPVVDMEDTKRQSRGPRPEEDFSEFGVVRVFSKPAPDAEDRLRRLFTILLKPPAGDGQAASGQDSPTVDLHVDNHLEAEA